VVAAVVFALRVSRYVVAVGRAIPISVSMLLVQVGDVGRCCRLGKMLLVEDAAELAKTKASEKETIGVGVPGRFQRPYPLAP